MLPVADSALLKAVAAIVLPLGVAVVVVAFAFRHQARENARRETAWRRFALDNRLDLKLVPGNWFKSGEFKIQGKIGELELEISTFRVQAGKSTQTWVKVRTLGRGPAGTFSVEHKNLLSRIGAMFGRDGVSIDEGEFDRQFFVRSSPESLARDLLDEPLRAHFASLIRSPKLSYSAGACELDWRAGEDSVEQLSAAVQLHAMLRGAFVRSARAAAR